MSLLCNKQIPGGGWADVSDESGVADVIDVGQVLDGGWEGVSDKSDECGVVMWSMWLLCDRVPGGGWEGAPSSGPSLPTTCECVYQEDCA